MHHGQSTGGKRNTHKVCKKQVNFSKTEGKFWQRREIRNLSSMTKKRSSEILADENRRIFWEKVKCLKFKFSIEFENLSKIGANLKLG